MSEQFDKANLSAGASAAEAQEDQSSPKPYIWREAFASMSLADRLNIRSQWFHTHNVDGQTIIDVYRDGQVDHAIPCISPGHANRVRQELSDMGMAGLIEGVLTWPNP